MRTESKPDWIRNNERIPIMIRSEYFQIALVTAILCFTLPIHSGTAEPASKPSLQLLAWLAGEWAFEKNGRVATEIWMSPAGGTMLGMSRTVTNGRTVEYEFILLRQDALGDIYYVAKPSGQVETSFKLIRATATEVIFENPQHDFPQRISYTLKPDGTLLAAIEGQKDGKFRRVEFPYHRKGP
jgi:Domain of unknown function (DUF6265)